MLRVALRRGATSPTWTRCSTRTPRCSRRSLDWARERYPKDPGDSDFVYKQTIKAKACDAARGILPAATLSNVGIYGTGQAFEALLLRMRAHPLPEARSYAAMMLEELRKVIPSFLARVDRADRGVAWSAYLAETRHDTARARRRGSSASEEPEPRPSVTLTDFDPDAEDKLLAAICYPHTASARRPGPRAGAPARRPTSASRCSRAYVGEREQPAPPPRARVRARRLPLRRRRRLRRVPRPAAPPHAHHRVAAAVARSTATTCRTPIDEAGLADRFDDAMARSAALHDALARAFPEQASYAVSLAYRIRFVMQMNAREAMHLLELRTAPSGHPSYRQVCQEMHRLIAEQAGHRAIAAAMSHVDHTTYELERLGAERAAELRRSRGDGARAGEG